MNKLIVLSMVDRNAAYNEDTETQVAIETTIQCVVNADAIRCFYKRKENRPGSRITFKDGGGFAVTDSVAVIAGLLGVELPPAPTVPDVSSDAAPAPAAAEGGSEAASETAAAIAAEAATDTPAPRASRRRAH